MEANPATLVPIIYRNISFHFTVTTVKDKAKSNFDCCMYNYSLLHENVVIAHLHRFRSLFKKEQTPGLVPKPKGQIQIRGGATSYQGVEKLNSSRVTLKMWFYINFDVVL